LLKTNDAYNFEGKRYDVGNKLGFLEATVEYALRVPGRFLVLGFMELLADCLLKK